MALLRRLAAVTAAGAAATVAAAGAGGEGLLHRPVGVAPDDAEPWHAQKKPPPPRAAQLQALRQGVFDVLVVGGARASPTLP